MTEEIHTETGLPMSTAKAWGLLPYPDPAATRLDARRKALRDISGQTRCYDRLFIVTEAVARAEFKANKLLVQKLNELLDIFKSNATTANKLAALALVEKLAEPTAQSAFAAIKDELRD